MADIDYQADNRSTPSLYWRDAHDYCMQNIVQP